MELIDRKGKSFTIIDVKGSIAMVQEFLNYKPSEETMSLQRLDEQRQLYWEDFLEKLQQFTKQPKKIDYGCITRHFFGTGVWRHIRNDRHCF